MDMVRKKKMVTLTLDPDLWAEIEAYIARQKYPPNKNTVVEEGLRMVLDAEKDEA